MVRKWIWKDKLRNQKHHLHGLLGVFSQHPFNQFHDQLSLTPVQGWLKGIQTLMARLGHPEKLLPPVIHITGTNGKGSVVAFLKAILNAAGYCCHTFTSPHLIEVNERIVVRDAPITTEELSDRAREIMKINGDNPLTLFELLTAIAFQAFTAHKADFVLCEVGLGGTFDSTNIIPSPLLAIITSVALDHCEILGPTLQDIAHQKAGIIKPQRPIIIGDFFPQDVKNVIEQRARRLKAPLLLASKPRRQGDAFFLPSHPDTFYPLPHLKGDHQLENVSLVLKAVDYLRPHYPIDDKAVKEGIKKVQWPGRLQRLNDGPLTSYLSAGQRLWLDGAHNPAAASAIVSFIQREWHDLPLFIILSLKPTKEIEEYLRFYQTIRSFIHAFYCLPLPGHEDDTQVERIFTTARILGFQCTQKNTLEECLFEINQQHPYQSNILITGSLYLVGEALRKSQ